KWIGDLSAPDPTSLFNLFGLLPFHVPTFLHIGILPILFGVSMFMQQKMTPRPADATQAQVMMYLPFIFTFIFSSFASGLVLYWIANNTLSVLQQMLIEHRMKSAKPTVIRMKK
ncbi:MAG: YidC/Oxa1 family membrane protein insertase, partial [Alphaproteobacteria bacterium]